MEFKFEAVRMADETDEAFTERASRGLRILDNLGDPANGRYCMVEATEVDGGFQRVTLVIEVKL